MDLPGSVKYALQEQEPIQKLRYSFSTNINARLIDRPSYAAM